MRIEVGSDNRAVIKDKAERVLAHIINRRASEDAAFEAAHSKYSIVGKIMRGLPIKLERLSTDRETNRYNDVWYPSIYAWGTHNRLTQLLKVLNDPAPLPIILDSDEVADLF